MSTEVNISWVKQANNERICDNGEDSSFFFGHLNLIGYVFEGFPVPDDVSEFVIHHATPHHQEGLRNLITAYNSQFAGSESIADPRTLSNLIALLSHSVESPHGNKRAIEERHSNLQYLFQIYTGQQIVL